MLENFRFYYVAVICTTTGRTQQTQACVSRYDQCAWKWRSSKWCTYCKHKCAAVPAYIQLCHTKKQNGKLVMHQKVS